MRKLLLKAALIPVLFALTGLYKPGKTRNKVGSNPQSSTSHKDNVTDAKTRAEKWRALQKRVDAGEVVKNDDGTYREVDTGRYMGSDGTAQDGSAAENAVIQEYREDGLQTHDKGPAARTPNNITGTWGTTFTDSKGERHQKGDTFTVPAGTPRFYDGFVNFGNENGDNWRGIETKSGDAGRTAQQRTIDEWLNSHDSHTLDVTLPDGSTITVNRTVDHFSQ